MLQKDNSAGMVPLAESFYKYETRVACGQASLHSCGGLVHEGLKVELGNF